MGINFDNGSQAVKRQVTEIELSDRKAGFNNDEKNKVSKLLSSGGLNEDEQAYVAARRDEDLLASVYGFDTDHINNGVLPYTTAQQADVFIKELLFYYTNTGTIDGFKSSQGFPEGVIGIQSVAPSIDYSDRSNDNVVFENGMYEETRVADSVAVSVRFIYQDPATGKQSTFLCKDCTRDLGVFQGSTSVVHKGDLSEECSQTAQSEATATPSGTTGEYNQEFGI